MAPEKRSGEKRWRVVFIFVDGLGLGEPQPEFNPCTADETGLLTHFKNDVSTDVPFGGRCLPLDAGLGVPGIPQSATGQTALLTGENAAQLLGQHRNGFPNKALRQVLKEKSLLKQIKERGFQPIFINAFRPIFFKLDERLKWLLSTTTVATLAAGLPFFTLEDVKAHRSIYQDFTNRDLIQKGFDVPEFTPEEAGQILAAQVPNYDFILYEYFKTDRAGHSQDMAQAVAECRKFSRFLEAFLQETNLGETQIILTSDHGNIEDLRTKNHTTNPAMTLLWGPLTSSWEPRLHALTDVTPVILSAFPEK